jgi:hypothetical protein
MPTDTSVSLSHKENSGSRPLLVYLWPMLLLCNIATYIWNLMDSGFQQEIIESHSWKCHKPFELG